MIQIINCHFYIPTGNTGTNVQALNNGQRSFTVWVHGGIHMTISSVAPANAHDMSIRRARWFSILL